ncbi:MAG: DUF4340 domain-containing protein [Verrucomicrobiae bacterium]|nr:DUF4340 domain-containing protein [Verrucomicrobiae bacterium]
MKPRNTLWLLLLTALVVGGYFLAKKKLPTTEETAERRKRVLDFKAADVTRLEIKGADRDFLFERKDGKWFFARPLQVRAASAEMDGILSGLEYLESRRRIRERDYAEAKLALADYGLEKPRASVIVRTPKGESTLLLGNEARQGDALYVQVKGDKDVHLVDKYLATRLEKKLEDYRERALFDFAADEVQRLELRGGGKLIEMARTNQLWRIVQPLNARADRGKMDEFLRELTSLRAEDFLSEDPAASREFGLEEPSQEVSVRLEKQDALPTLLLGAKLKADEKKIAARVKGQNSIVAVAAAFAAAAGRPLNDLRDRDVAAFSADAVREIEVRHRASVLLLQKTNDQWRIVQPDKVAADASLVESLLTRLSGMQVKEFAADVITDLDKYGLKAPLAQVTLRDRARDSAAGTNAPLLDLAIGKAEAAKKLVYVKRADESSIYAVDAAEAAALPKDPLDLRSRVLFEIKKEAIQSVIVKKGKSALTIEKAPEGAWKLGEGAVGVLAETPWQRLLNRLQHFEVAKIEGTAIKSLTTLQGFDPPAATVLVTGEFEGKTTTQELVVGRAIGATHAIVWKNQFLLAEITKDDYQTLTADFLAKAPSANPPTSDRAPAPKKP